MRAKKEQLLKLLGEPDIKVMALSGKRETGETHLLGGVVKEAHDEAVRRAL